MSEQFNDMLGSLGLGELAAGPQDILTGEVPTLLARPGTVQRKTQCCGVPPHPTAAFQDFPLVSNDQLAKRLSRSWVNLAQPSDPPSVSIQMPTTLLVTHCTLPLMA